MRAGMQRVMDMRKGALVNARAGGEARRRRLAGRPRIALQKQRVGGLAQKRGDARSGVVYAIRSIVDPDPDHPGAWLDRVRRAADRLAENRLPISVDDNR